MLLSVLSNPDPNLVEDYLLEAYLDYGVQIVSEGNNKVQKTIFNYCQNYTESEYMFQKFEKIIQEQKKRLTRK